MPKINSFLRRGKSQENGFGIIMIVAAYVVSALLLILVSDLFYGVTTKAEQLAGTVGEVTTNESKKIIDPYGTDLYELVQNPEETMGEEISDDTYWLLGSAMDTDEYMGFLTKLNEVGEAYDKTKVVKEEKVVSETIAYKVSKEERTMLERIVEAEAGSEDIIGRVLVANVIFNRIADQEFPDTIKEVIFQKVNGTYQFSPIRDKRYWSVEISDKTKKAVKKALAGEDYSEGALYFMARKLASKKNAKWFDNNLTWLFKHGVHEFFKD